MRALIFSGTGDGRKLCEYLSEKGIDTTVCVATEYGKEIMGEMKNIKIYSGRLEEREIENIAENVDVVIDATHPYAQNITKNIKCACENKNKKYLRMIRDENAAEGSITVENIEYAAEYLNEKEGRIFVSTGSNEIEKYKMIKGYKKRVRARVLDTEDARKKCKNSEIEDILYKMPPYSVEDNLNDFKGCKYLVTKSSGKVGGFDEKIKAAKMLGMEVIVIKRPNESGYSIEEIKAIIERNMKNDRNIRPS